MGDRQQEQRHLLLLSNDARKRNHRRGRGRDTIHIRLFFLGFNLPHLGFASVRWIDVRDNGMAKGTPL
jgi:hypothetical protein